MKLDKFGQRILESRKRLNVNIYTRVAPAVASIVDDLKLRSPKDSGQFAAGWQVLRHSTITRGGGYKFIITNSGTNYGYYLDTGAELGGPPWYWPRDDATVADGATSNSGKLIYANGRVWAGGRTQPEKHVVGGIIDPVLFDTDSERATRNQDKVVEAVAIAVMESL